MRFFSRYLLSHALVVLVATLLIHYLKVRMPFMTTWVVIPVWLLYMTVIALSVVLLERRDPYQGFFGFNYHLATYVLCIGVPLLLHATGFLGDISFVPSMAAFWGVGLAVHLIVFLVIFRKRRLKSYDKKEIFQ